MADIKRKRHSKKDYNTTQNVSIQQEKISSFNKVQESTKAATFTLFLLFSNYG